MSQDNELSNIIRDLRHMEKFSTKPSNKEWSDMHRRIIQLPRTDRRQLYKRKEYVPLEEVLDWQQTCPPDKRITDVGANSEEDIRIAFEINKRVAIWRGTPTTIECDALLRDYIIGDISRISYTRSRRFTIYRERRFPVNYIYAPQKMHIDEGTVIEFLTHATQSRYRSLVIGFYNSLIPDGNTYANACNIMGAVKWWLEQNYNLVDKIIFCADEDFTDGCLKSLIKEYFPVYDVNIPESKLPAEILRKGSRAIQIYKEALSNGKHAVQNIRVMLVGQSGVGKTTLLKRLLGQDVDIKKIESTEGIEVHVHRCKIDLKSGRWHCQDEVLPHPNDALHAAILTHLTKTPKESFVQTVQNTSPKSDTSPIHDDEVTIASEPESDKSDALASTALPSAILPLLTGTPEDTSPKSDTSSTTDDEFINRRQQNVTGVDVTIASEPESEKSDALGSPVRPQSSSNKSDDTKVEQQIKELMETYESSKRLSDSNFANVSFWDFAGQYIFYNTHQVFLSHRTVYLLVTKLKHIVDKADPQGQDSHGTIKFWVDSIHFFCGKENHDPRVPPVILVATHCDKVDQAQKEIIVQNHFQKVRDIFANKITAGHIVDDLEFAVNNSVKDPELEELKEAILEVAKTQYYWQEEHPVRWLTLEKELFVKGNSGEKVLQLEAVKDINRMLPFPLEDTELDLFLQFQSDLGNILYISDGELKDYVLLNPQWVADAFKCIITAERFLNRKMKLRNHWKQAKKTGKINTEIIEAVWSDKKSEGFFEEREFLLLLMQQLNLIARPIGTEQPPSHYFVPCLINERPRCLPIPFKGEATSVLTLSAASRFFPLILFHKLIASCIHKYPIHKKHIYYDSALFVDGVHVFTVLYVDNTVKVWVNILDKAIPNSRVCQNILKFLIECLHQLLQLSCSKTPSVAIFICCPKVDVCSVQGMYQLPNDTDLWQAQSKEKVACSNESCASHSISIGDALKHWITGPTNAEDQTYKNALAKAWARLVEEMDSRELLDKFMEKELLSPVAIRDLRDEKITSQRNRKVLEKVRTLGPEKYEVFKECLTLIKQEHLAKLLHNYERDITTQDEADAIVTPDMGTCSNPEDMAQCDVDQDNVTTNKPIVSKKTKTRTCMLC